MGNGGERLRGPERTGSTARQKEKTTSIGRAINRERATTGSAARQKEKEQILKKLAQSKYPEESRAYRDTLKKYDLTPREAKRVEGILKKQSER